MYNGYKSYELTHYIISGSTSFLPCWFYFIDTPIVLHRCMTRNLELCPLSKIRAHLQQYHLASNKQYHRDTNCYKFDRILAFLVINIQLLWSVFPILNNLSLISIPCLIIAPICIVGEGTKWLSKGPSYSGCDFIAFGTHIFCHYYFPQLVLT